jgi:hypothetical protein
MADKRAENGRKPYRRSKESLTNNIDVSDVYFLLLKNPYLYTRKLLIMNY